MRGGAATTKKMSKAESDALTKAEAAAQALLESLVAPTGTAPAKVGSKKIQKSEKKKERMKKRHVTRREAAPPKVEKNEEKRRKQ